MHRMSWPNRITITRIVLIAPFVVALIQLQDPVWGGVARWSALATFALMAVSDGLDGYLARRLHQETALGKFLDPLADKLLILCSVVLLARQETQVPGVKLPAAVAVIAVGKDLTIVTGFCIIYFITSRAYIDARGWGKWCTTVQLLMIISVLLFPNLPAQLRLLPNVLWWAATVLAVAATVQYFHLGRAFIADHESHCRAAPRSESIGDSARHADPH